MSTRTILTTSVMVASLAFTSCNTATEKCPIYPEAVKTLVYQEMKDRTLIRDLHIGQDDCHLSLVIIIGYAANEKYAKEQGDDMVRLTKSFGPGPAPGKEIGEGLYDYLIGIYRLDETEVALGAKAKQARRISW